MLNFAHFRNCFATIPFTSEQDRFIVMAHLRSGTLNPDGNWSYSLQSCIEQFMQQYPDEMIEYDIFKQHKFVSIAPSKPHDVETSTEANFRNEIEPQAVPDSYTTNVDDSPYVEEPFQDSGRSYSPSEEYGSDSTSDVMEKAPDEEQESSSSFMKVKLKQTLDLILISVIIGVRDANVALPERTKQS
ncbi:hypothetical protein FQA39_LY04565 [Lamprigera yunnana]|nr:hypothetical protein FQA39_LY04565 [Lamprigera yunnana]